MLTELESRNFNERAVGFKLQSNVGKLEKKTHKTKTKTKTKQGTSMYAALKYWTFTAGFGGDLEYFATTF